jgi:hypothetical protein
MRTDSADLGGKILERFSAEEGKNFQLGLLSKLLEHRLHLEGLMLSPCESTTLNSTSLSALPFSLPAFLC